MTAHDVLRIERRFDTAPERVFDALIDNDLTRESFLASGMEDCVVERDVRVGGTWRIAARGHGHDLVSSGEYLEVDRPRRLVFTFAMPQFSPNQDRITATLAPHGDGCTLTFTQDGPDIAAELRDLASGEKGGSERGWEAMLDFLSQTLR